MVGGLPFLLVPVGRKRELAVEHLFRRQSLRSAFAGDHSHNKLHPDHPRLVPSDSICKHLTLVADNL